MTGNNGYFTYSDPYTFDFAGFKLHESWWSRTREYPWALQFAQPEHVCADMGCGWMQRPFKDALAAKCSKVYAVDASPEVLKLEPHDNMQFVVADITQDTGIEAESLDRVYCISVLEDLGDLVKGALKEFARVLKPDGRVIITCDSAYDRFKPLPAYPGVNIDRFIDAVWAAGLMFDGGVDFDKTDAVFQPDWNLCCWHCVLRKA